MPRDVRVSALHLSAASPPPAESAPIPYRTIAEHVAQWIRQGIARRQFPPGARLREAAIARELRTSRAPVREAIGQLEREGLVVKRPNQSPRIVEPTESMLREVATLRGVLESYGASLAIERLDAEGLRALGGILRTMQQAVRRGEFSRVFELDVAFHEFVMQSAGHRLLYEMWSRMGGQVRLLVSGTNLMDQELARTVRLHRKILAAFRTRDREAAQRLMGMHEDELFERFVARVIRETPATQPAAQNCMAARSRARGRS
jgi:DNA-binding GntR family transcriptional regulator